MRSRFALAGVLTGILLSHHALAGGRTHHEASRSVDDAVQMLMPRQKLTFNPSGAASMPACRVPLATSILQSDDRSIRTAKVQCTSPAWTLYVGFRLDTLISAPIITRPVGAGEVIGPSDFVMRDVAADQISGKPIPPGALRQGGVTASFDLRPGELISDNDTNVIPVVRNGEHIRVTMSSPLSGLTLTTTAIALENGAIGQTVEVENRQTHERFNAKIVESIPKEEGLYIVTPNR